LRIVHRNQIKLGVLFACVQCKHRLHMFGLAVPLVVCVFGLLNTHAFEGDMLGVELNQVNCTNTTTGATMPGNILPGGVYDCETVPTQSGEAVTATLSGVASRGSVGCIDVVENETSPPPLVLADGACFNLMGTIAVGSGATVPFPPDYDIDIFLFQIAVPTGVRLSLIGDKASQFRVLALDGGEGTLICFLTPESCRGDLIIGGLGGVSISAIAPGPYTLKVRVVTMIGVSPTVRRHEVSNHDVITAMEEAMRQLVER